MTEPKRPNTGTEPGAPGSPDDDDAPIADLVARIRRSEDPRAALLRPLSDAERGAMADRVLASFGEAKAARPSPRARAPSLRRAAWILPLAAAFALAVALILISRRGPQLVAYR